MIPIRLELKNFMSYGADVPALDFAGMHTLCLSGENGHGKSALLDALTWSLWGESRAGKNKHDELVRIGADEMSVHFTFEMDGQRYRVVRKRSKKASGNVWQLQGETPDQGLGIGWHPMTGNTDRETELAIQKLLRMSYDTFLNSAYLRQGQADQFVRQTAAKRKEILADILDLSRYDQLETKARERMKSAQADATDLDRDISGIDAELRDEAGLRESLAELQGRLDTLDEQRVSQRAEWETVQERRTLLRSQAELAAALTKQIRDLAAEIREYTEELTGHRDKAEQARALLSRQDEINGNFAKLLEARTRVVASEAAVTQLHRGEQALAAAEKEWMAAENDVERRMERAVREHDQAAARLLDLPQLERERDTLAPHVAAADKSEADRKTLSEALAADQETFTRLREENARLDFQTNQWSDRIKTLDSQTGVCQVCDAPLPPEKVASTRADYEAILSALLTERKAVRAEAGTLKTRLADGQVQMQSLDTQIRAANQGRVRLGQVDQRLLELEAVTRDLPNLASLRDQAVKVVSEGHFAPELRAKIVKIEAALKNLFHAEADYAAVRAELMLLEPSERLHIALEHAQSALSTAEVGENRARKAIQARQVSQAAAQTQLGDLADVGAELAKLNARDLEIRDQEAQRSREHQNVSQDIGRRQQTLTRLEELKVVRADKAKRLIDARYDAEVHDQLTRAFGKKGVQALIIENAIPELMEETNRLLDKLTDGDMSLYFETVKESKSKKDSPIETLEIKVSDNLGTRPLEMYSGGEGFRAAFALRIALSKLLARRAGARLQTLIIDEGFGSQDAKGREKLVECIDTIKDDFERIIVITHIDELKDAFATRVEITKTASGSQITVMDGSGG